MSPPGEGIYMTIEFSIDSEHGAVLAAQRWDPAGSPRTAVLLVHGMGEHIRRYDETARALTAEGCVVVGYDHRGHGRSVIAGHVPGDLGPDGWAALVADMGRVIGVVRAEYPDLPLVMIAHSMGSFAAQQFLLEHSDDVDAVVLSGTAALDALEPALDFDSELDLSMFNAPFEPARTDFDWLSRDTAVVDEYVADPLCGFGLDLDSTRAMFVGARRVADPALVRMMRRDLPILIAVGDQDPVGGGGALVDQLATHYRGAGLTDVTVRVFTGGRHEILNETNRTQVRSEIAAWITRVIGRSET
jgi:alpha-beta hydrolase superfamily lysophospholipase